MKNTITDLNNYLFEQLERVNDDSLTGEELEQAIEKAEVVAKISETIIKNNELAFKVMKHKTEYGIKDTPGILALEGK